MHNLANRLTRLDSKLNYAETVSRIEEICQEEFGAKSSKVIDSSQAREKLIGLTESELEQIRDRKPIEKENSVYIPLKNNGSNLGLLYLQETKACSQEMLSFVSSLGGLILSLQKDKEKSRYDGLTGLLRKDEFKEKEEYSYIMIDIDNFKKYNDSYGHLQGDTALAAVGKVVRENVRGKDVGVRYGGEEMLVALYETNQEGVKTAAERIRKEVAELVLQTDKLIENKKIYLLGPERITVSIGYGSSISAADTALYQAKSSGKNKISGK
ncbi:MAG: GGDEF domain-containing protein [Candidatus Woesearchaeota archaeon]